MELRASDADREKYAAVLREGFAEGRLDPDEYEDRLDRAMRARTYAELAALVTDLPAMPGAPNVPSVPSPVGQQVFGPVGLAGVPVVAGGSKASDAIAVFGGAERGGVWTVPEQLNALAMFGGVKLDLTHASLAAPRVTIQAVAIFGGVEITVPAGATVEVEGMGIFGGFDRKGEGPGPAGAPTIRITGVAIFGGVEVKRAPWQQLPPSPPPPPAVTGR
jgi:hypothetical protein